MKTLASRHAGSGIASQREFYGGDTYTFV